MTEFYFIRHGQTDWNARELMQGHTDIPLNDIGLKQANIAGKALLEHNIQRLVCSPLERCLQTGQEINTFLNMPLSTDARLKERFFGDYEGTSKHDIPRDEHGHIMGDIETVEPFNEVIARAKASIMDTTSEHTGETILFVSHGGVGAALHAGLCESKVMLDNAVPYHFFQENGIWRSQALL